MQNPHQVATLIYPGLCTFEFACVVEMFALHRPELAHFGIAGYELTVCGLNLKPVQGLGGITVRAKQGLDGFQTAQTIVLPGWCDIDKPVPRALTDALRRAHERGARIASICSGVFILAAAGLLNDKAATTHWRYAQSLAQRYPRVRVKSDSIYVDEGSVLSSAGSAAGLDMMLHLVRKDYGAKVANSFAQRLVLPPHRLGNQAQFVARPMGAHRSSKIAGLCDYLRCNLGAEHCLSSMSKKSNLSPRSLQRQFVDATGMAPLIWLTKERVQLAKDLLESNDLPTARIAADAGFGSEEVFRKHFKRWTGTTPGSYRAQFNKRL